MDKRTSNIVAIVITVVWAASFLADIISTSYEPSPYIHAIMMTVAGAAFADSVIRKDDRRNDRDNDHNGGNRREDTGGSKRR